MDTYTYREPLGVCAGVCPFNFPAMIPLWVSHLLLLLLPLSSSSLHHLQQMFPLACVVGNTFVMKPSEQDPGACMMLAQMAQDAGLPDGVLNVIHGQKEGQIINLFYYLL